MNIFHNDAYQLSMLYAHWKNERVGLEATAEAFFRRYPHPDDQNMVVMAGAYRINELLNSDEFQAPFSYDDMPYLQNEVLKLSDEEFEPFGVYLMETFPQELADLEVSYVRDGEVLYWDFPVVQVSGSIGALHMLETPILSILNSSVRAATAARRLRRVAGDKVKLLDFATRRQDDEAAIHTAVAAVLGGFDGTSNLEAGRLYHVPAGGTMAHAYVLSYGMDGELRAFQDFMRTYPQQHVLLVDTFDIMGGVANAIRASFETGIALRAIRLDSGDWPITIPAVRKMLDLMGFQDTKLVVSGDYNEALIHSLYQSCPDFPKRTILDLIDVIGIGSYLACPDFSMGFVYKLVAIDGKPVMKLAGAKSSLPGRKVWLKGLDGGNHLKTWPYPTVGEFEEVLQPDSGPFPVSADYIRDARSLTEKRVAAKERYWDKTSVLNAAKSISR